MNTDLLQWFAEYGLVGGSFLLFMLLIAYLLKKMIDIIPIAIKKHFETIDKLVEKHSTSLENIALTFEKRMQESNSWHKKHSEEIKNVWFKVKKIENHLKIN